jgi:aminopeptidase N
MNDFAWGQAPAGIMFITKEAFNPLIDVTSRYYSKGVNQRFAHEIAHQYWGQVVKMGSAEEQWITESFAEFATALVVKELEGQSGYDSLIAWWRVDAKEAGDFAPIALAHRISIPKDPAKASEHRFKLVYSKGAYALVVLRKQVGDPKFFSWMRNLQGQYAWRFLTTADAAKLMQRIDGGKDYQPFFDRYVWGTEMPEMPK